MGKQQQNNFFNNNASLPALQALPAALDLLGVGKLGKLAPKYFSKASQWHPKTAHRRRTRDARIRPIVVDVGATKVGSRPPGQSVSGWHVRRILCQILLQNGKTQRAKPQIIEALFTRFTLH